VGCPNPRLGDDGLSAQWWVDSKDAALGRNRPSQ
jgi:hypothetical protein